MRVNVRPSLYVVAAALLGLIALLATLQYRWLGQVSAAERERMQASLTTRSTAFVQDFDREITRAYLMFQIDSLSDGANLAAQVADRYDRWQATSRYPRLVKEIYIVPQEDAEAEQVRRFNTTTRFIEPAPWPESLEPIRAQLAPQPAPSGAQGNIVVRTMAPTVWESVPALLVPMPVMLVNTYQSFAPLTGTSPDMRFRSHLSHTVLVLDRDYISNELFPALVQQHFRGANEGIDYDLAVVSTARKATLYSTDTGFTPESGGSSDASAEFFQIRTQENAAMAAEVRRFNSFVARVPSAGTSASRPEEARKRATEMRSMVLREGGRATFTMRDAPPVAIMLQHSINGSERSALEQGVAVATGQALRSVPAAHWRLVVKHPAGSLETAVANVRRRNLLVSSGILAVLGASVGFLLVSTRRAHDLARQQMEFVAAVSHELRTPLAVIRSAADNLAEGVVHGEGQVRRYGELVRGEGRRLSEMVEQILELAGIQSGQRGFALRPVPVLPLVHEVVRASEPLLQDAGLHVEYQVDDGLPPVLGDEGALRRVVQNLVGNAIKYGASGGWIGIKARSVGREVQVTIADRGIGIAPAEKENIFKPFYRSPDVIAAQIQGAGLGLSLVHRIVEAHGGRITVESTVGEGSAFTVHLPAASEEPVTRPSSAANPAASGARG
jgi:two-component system sensor histidine kinase SenX3